jgi:alpha-L-rhamnosidase
VCDTYECDPWLSQKMKMFGSLDKFFYRNLAGIEPESPGYGRIRIEPQPVGDLRRVSVSERTVRGTVSVEWERKNDVFDLKVVIPAGVEGDIAVPTLGLTKFLIEESGAVVWKSDAYVSGTSGLTGARDNAKSILFNAGSGCYRFMLRSIESAYTKE